MMASMHSRMEAQVELPHDLKRFEAAEDERGMFSVLRDGFHVLLGVGAIIALVYVALGWN